MRDVRTTESSDTAAWMAARIVELDHTARRDLFPGEADTAAAGPLVGFAKGDDPLFTDFKRHVGASHWTPLEAFGLAFPTLPAAAAELTVISSMLPHPEQVKADNRSEKSLPAESWAQGKARGERLNDVLREQTVKIIRGDRRRRRRPRRHDAVDDRRADERLVGATRRLRRGFGHLRTL